MATTSKAVSGKADETMDSFFTVMRMLGEIV